MFLKEAKNTTWLANVMLVKMASGKLPMCVNNTNLNKACPKDTYPLSNIDRLVDGATGQNVLSFSMSYISKVDG